MIRGARACGVLDPSQMLGCSKIRINGALRGTPHVQVVDAYGETLGVMTLANALRAAMKAGLDLVEVNPSARPPLCQLLAFTKYKARDA